MSAYLCRVAHAQGYSGPLSLAQIAGLPRSGLEGDANAKQLADLLRVEPEEWRTMCYRHINGRTRFDQRLFCGERISADGRLKTRSTLSTLGRLYLIMKQEVP
jgi:hypothetical protein